MNSKNNYGDLNSSRSSTEGDSVELGSVTDVNHIHFVSVCRIKDNKILLNAITNR